MGSRKLEDDHALFKIVLLFVGCYWGPVEPIKRWPDMAEKSPPSERQASLDNSIASVAVLREIHDGMLLAYFPSHYDSPHCWCRPRVTVCVSEVLIQHKDLANGEFDC